MPYGAQIKFGIGLQTAAGSGNAVAAAGSFHHLTLLSENLGITKDEVISANLTGRFEQGASYDGLQKVNGTISFEATPKALGAILSGIMQGTKVLSGTNVANYQFLPRTADFSSTLVGQPVTLYKQFAASSVDLYFDAQLSQLQFTFAQGQLLKAQVTVGGGTRAGGAPNSLGITLDTNDLGLGFTWDTTSITWGGTALGAMSEVTVALNENIDPVYTLNGTLAPYKFTRSGFREVTVNGTLFFDSRSVYDDFLAGTQRQLKINAVAKKVMVDSGQYARFYIDVPQLKLTTMVPGAGGPGEVSAQFTGRGVIDPTSNYTLGIQLVNTYAVGY